MAQDLKASVSFVGDGTTTKFYFGFDYISKQFIKVAVGTDDTILSYPTDYTVNDKEVEFVEAPAKDTPIRIYRQTDSSRIIEWSDGSFIKASQMTLENVQQLHLIEESQDYVIINGMSKYPDGVNFNALGARVINVSDPTEPQDAVTKHYMETVQGGFVSQNAALVQQATTQANNAKNSASSAATSASQSASSATKANTSNISAKAWAMSSTSPDNASDSQSTTGKTQSSKTWALYSKTKAQEAATSATNSKTSENNAKTQATNSATSASQSASSASASATSASNAKTAETNAKTSETNAKTSETNAKTSETNAKTSETNAAKSAKQAAESAGVFQDFKGATTTTDGTAGKVPKPLKGEQTLYLKGDGTWSNPSICYGNKMNITDTSGNELEENILSFRDTNNTERITCKARYKSDDGNGGIEYRMRLLTAPTSWYDLRVHVDKTSQQMYAYLASNKGVNLPFGYTDSSTNIPTTAWVQSAINTKLSPVATNANSREKVNSSGLNWIRYESGLQLCWTGSVDKQSVWTYPVAFSSNPVINGTSVVADWVYIDSITPTSCRSRCNSTCMMMAVGRWK